MAKRVLFLKDLAKNHISAMNAMAGCVGYRLAMGGTHPDISRYMFVFASIFLVAAGASALNQVQEWETDRAMVRTRERPVPSGRLKRSEAIGASLFFLSSGLVLLAVGGGRVPLVLGLLGVFLYNFLYTPLKMVTPLSLLPGVFVGVVPPAIGWAFSGRPLASFSLVVLSGFFVLWQVPHFFLLYLNWEDDYKRAGIRTAASFFPRDILLRHAALWVFSSSVLVLLVPLTGGTRGFFSPFLLLGSSIFVVVSFLWDRRKEGEKRHSSLFRAVNLYAAFVLLVLLVG